MVNINITAPFNTSKLDITKLIDWAPIISKLKIAIAVLIVLVLLYIVYLLIKFIARRIREKRIKVTYENTEDILKILERIEAKLDSMSKERTKSPKKEKNKPK